MTDLSRGGCEIVMTAVETRNVESHPGPFLVQASG
jgi:hypothetical protein